MASDNALSRAMQLARIALAFGRVERATFHDRHGGVTSWDLDAKGRP